MCFVIVSLLQWGFFLVRLQNAPLLFPPGLEPGTFRVLGERDNHYTTETGCTLSATRSWRCGINLGAACILWRAQQLYVVYPTVRCDLEDCKHSRSCNPRIFPQHTPNFVQVRMAERSKALRSGRSLVLQAWVRIPLLTKCFCVCTSNPSNWGATIDWPSYQPHDVGRRCLGGIYFSTLLMRRCVAVFFFWVMVASWTFPNCCSIVLEQHFTTIPHTIPCCRNEHHRQIN